MPDRRRRLIVGNWKMNGLRSDGLALATALAERSRNGGSRHCDIAICPPATLMCEIAEIIGKTPIGLGAQDCHMAEGGAHTGDISAPMLRDLGCRYVIVGHSERRADHAETNATVLSKASAAHSAGMAAIVCLGETEADRDDGRATEVVRAQLVQSLPDDRVSDTSTIIAYEPVWAIGTGRTPTPVDVEAMHAVIRADLVARYGSAIGNGMRLLYGGSVKPSNAEQLLQLANVNGALVGGASLKLDDFWAIVESCP